MASLRRLTPVVLSLAVGLSADFQFAAAEDAVVQHFGNWKVTIQPGVRTESVLIPPSPTASPLIRLVSQTEPIPVDQELLPPAPAKPEDVEIIPEQIPTASSAVTSNTEPAPCRSVDPLALVQIYPQVYNSIPFSRAEYAANPSYRHDATMEFLFGQLRPTVIQRGTTTVNNRNTAGYAPSPAYSPYGFNSYYFPFYQGYQGYNGYYNYGGYHRPYSLW